MLVKKIYKNGFTVVEILISIFIISIITISLSIFTRDVFSLNTTLSGSMNSQLDARHLIKIIVAELRKTSTSSVGSYPILQATDNSITFYSDVDDNGIKDQVRYFLDGNTVKRGVIAPNGNPLVYHSSNEKITTMISGTVSSSTQPMFQYYPSSYSGNTDPLSQPVNISIIRLIKITLIIDKDPGHSPVPLVVTSQVSLRNLKDNL